MHSMSLHVGYPRSPFKFSAFINALLFLCHTSGFEVVPGKQCPLVSELQHRTAFEVSFVAEHQRRTAFRAPTPECIQAPTPDYVQTPTPDYIRAPTLDYIRGVISPWFKKVEGV